MSTNTTDTAWYVDVENEYGSRRLVAHVWKTDSDSFTRNDYEDFRVVAWIDHDHTHPFGTTHAFQGRGLIELRQAEFMVKTLRKLQRGLSKANAEQGYLADEDFSGYLFRVASVLGIKTYYVPSTAEQPAVLGERWQRVHATGVQDYLWSVRRKYCRASESV